MRFANVNGRSAILHDDRWIDVHVASEGRFDHSPQAIFDRWDDLGDWAIQLGGAGSEAAITGPLGAPVPAPRQIFAIGLNYRAHAVESNLPIPNWPVVFTKFQSSLCGHNAQVELPNAGVDWEVELVAVIGRTSRHVALGDAWSHIAGLTVGQDLSDRAMQLGGPVPQFSLGKSYPGFSPIGPVLVTPDEFADPDDLELSCDLDGEELQRGRTSDLIFGVPALVAHLSSVLTLYPGDLIFTGTPAGVGMGRDPQRYLTPGVLSSHLENVGTLRVHLTTRKDESHGHS